MKTGLTKFLRSLPVGQEFILPVEQPLHSVWKIAKQAGVKIKTKTDKETGYTIITRKA